MTPTTCIWPMDAACRDEDWLALDDEVQERALVLASSTLRRLVAGRVGHCPITVRYEPHDGVCGWTPIHGAGFDGYYGSFQPYLGEAGIWRNSGGRRNSCEVTLPPPVGRVDSILLNGVPSEMNQWALLDGRILKWNGAGACPIPHHTADGTMQVTYLNAYPVDSMGAVAVGLLAVEFAKACSGKKCGLPPGVRSIVRQGVSYQIEAGLFPDGFTGIKEVDAWIMLWNPRARVQPSTVTVPGQHAGFRNVRSLG